jgi:3-(3-hydroxy-phenyl)propionate hydroxylase
VLHIRPPVQTKIRTAQALSLAETQELINPCAGPIDALPPETEVAIVGAGPVGLTASNLLSAFGVSNVVVERRRHTADLPRAIAIDDEFMRTLDGVGVAERLIGHISEPFGVHFLSPLGFASVKVPGFITPNGFGNRNAVLQPVFEKILLDASREGSKSCISYDTELSSFRQIDGGIELVLKAPDGERRLRARYLLACDGARSLVRESLNIPFSGTRIDEPHLVVDLADFPDQARHSRFFCNPRRPVNSIPAPYGGRRMEFMLLPGDNHELISSDAGLRVLVDDYTPYKGTHLSVIRRAIYGFSERIAAKFKEGNIFLLGDAAHVMPPFGGQGMNTGARDAANLCWKLALVLRAGATERVLDTYEVERRDHVAAIVNYSVRVGRLANIHSYSLALLRDLTFVAANLFPGIRRYFREMRHLPKPYFAAGLLVPDGRDGASLLGRIMPRLRLEGKKQGNVTIDELAGNAHALIGVEVDSKVLHEAATHPLWHALQTVCLAISLDKEKQDEESFVCSDDGMKRMLDIYVGKIIVVRPDRYVAGIAEPKRFKQLSNELLEKYSLNPV